MRFVSARDLRRSSAEVWRDLPVEREMVITHNGRPIAILASVNESNLEELLSALRRARACVAVATLQHGSVAGGADKLTTGEIEAEIAAVRARRHATHTPDARRPGRPYSTA
jgi:antitoxin (DNA-binding transcriptional repressor) of toxin-antitoxin stability system